MTSIDSHFSLGDSLSRGGERLLSYWKPIALVLFVLFLAFVSYLIYRHHERQVEDRLALDFYQEVLSKDLKGEARVAALETLKTRYAATQGVRFLKIDELLVQNEAKAWDKLEALSAQFAETEQDPHLKALLWFAAARGAENQYHYDQAIAYLDHVLLFPKDSPYTLLASAEKGRVLIVSGKRAEGERMLDEMQKTLSKPELMPLKSWIQDVLIWSQVYDAQKTGS